MRQLQAGDRHLLPLRPRQQHPARHLGPAQLHHRAGGRGDPERAALPGDHAARADQGGGQPGTDRRQQAGTGRPDRLLVGPPPARPADQGRLGRARDQRDRQLPGQPAPGPRERSRRPARPGREVARPGSRGCARARPRIRPPRAPARSPAPRSTRPRPGGQPPPRHRLTRPVTVNATASTRVSWASSRWPSRRRTAQPP